MENITPSQITISADGKCLHSGVSLRQFAEDDRLETIDIIIDGTQLLGGKNAPSLLGEGAEFLSQSRSFTLKEFIPQDDGRCIARYQRT